MKILHGHWTETFHVLPLNPMIERIVIEKRWELRKRMYCQIAYEKPPKKYFTPLRFQDVSVLVENYLDEALQSLPHYNGHIWISFDTTKNYPVLKIEDDGCGYPLRNTKSFLRRVKIQSSLVQGTTVEIDFS